MTGSGKLELTGQLGDVMKESAKAAMLHSFCAKQLNIDMDFTISMISIYMFPGSYTQGWPVGRNNACDCHGFGIKPPACQQECGNDRRNHAAWKSASGRRT